MDPVETGTCDQWINGSALTTGSCRQMMNETYPTGFDNETMIATVCRGIIKALVYLHENHYIHKYVFFCSLLLTSIAAIFVLIIYLWT
jgi:serine/threonine protein kinase